MKLTLHRRNRDTAEVVERCRALGVDSVSIYCDVFPGYDETRVPAWKWRNQRVEELLEKGRQILDVKERSAIYSEAYQIITNEAPRFTIWHRTHNVAMKKSVQNYTIRHDSMVFWDGVTKS